MQFKKDVLGMYVAGIIYGVGLWFLIDATVISHRSDYNTVSDKEFGLNIPSHSQIKGDGIDFDGNNKQKIQIWLIFSFVVVLGGVACGCVVSGMKFLDYKAPDGAKYSKAPGTFLLLSSILLALGATVYRFARSFESDDDSDF